MDFRALYDVAHGFRALRRIHENRAVAASHREPGLGTLRKLAQTCDHPAVTPTLEKGPRQLDRSRRAGAKGLLARLPRFLVNQPDNRNAGEGSRKRDAHDATGVELPVKTGKRSHGHGPPVPRACWHDVLTGL